MKKMLLTYRFLKSKSALCTAIYFFAFLFCFFGIRYIHAHSLGEIFVAVMLLMAFFLPLMLYKQTEAGKRSNIGFNAFSPQYLSRGMLCLVGLSFISFAIYTFFCARMTFLGILLPSPADAGEYARFLMAYILIPVLAEELVLRGAWQGADGDNSAVGTVILSGVMTASFGFDLFSFFYLLLFGLCASLLRWQSGSVWPGVLVGFVWRVGMLLLLPLFDPFVLPFPVRVVILCVGIVLGTGLVFLSVNRNAVKDRVYFSADTKKIKPHLFALLTLAVLGLSFVGIFVS